MYSRVTKKNVCLSEMSCTVITCMEHGVRPFSYGSTEVRGQSAEGGTSGKLGGRGWKRTKVKQTFRKKKSSQLSTNHRATPPCILHRISTLQLLALPPIPPAASLGPVRNDMQPRAHHVHCWSILPTRRNNHDNCRCSATHYHRSFWDSFWDIVRDIPIHPLPLKHDTTRRLRQRGLSGMRRSAF
jgi:hypothetical protein